MPEFVQTNNEYKMADDTQLTLSTITKTKNKKKMQKK